MPLRRLRKITTPNIVKSDLCVCGPCVVEFFRDNVDCASNVYAAVEPLFKTFSGHVLREFFNSSCSSTSLLPIQSLVAFPFIVI